MACMAARGDEAARTRGWRPTQRGLLVAGMVVVFSVIAPPTDAQERYELDQGQWQQVQAPEPGTPEAALQEVRRALANEQGERAEELAAAWIKQHPNHPLLPEAYLLRGDAKVARRHYYDALFDYEYLIQQYPASDAYHTALAREYEIARLFVNGMKRRFMGMRILPAQEEGEELLIRIQERAPGSELGERATLTLADYYFESGEMANAAEVYDLFLENYPASQQREWAMLRLIQANLARFNGPRFDTTALIEAAERLRTYRQEYPASADRIGADALLVRIAESRAMSSYLTAQWYEQRGETVSAAYAYRRVVEDFPQTAAAEQALAELGRIPDPILAGLPGSGRGQISPGADEAPSPTPTELMTAPEREPAAPQPPTTGPIEPGFGEGDVPRGEVRPMPEVGSENVLEAEEITTPNVEPESQREQEEQAETPTDVVK